MNAETTEFLNTIAKPRTNRAISYSYKPIKERWYAESIIWDVNEEIASEYEASIEIEQGSLYYRGTWLKVTARAPFKDYGELEEICRKNEKKRMMILTISFFLIKFNVVDDSSSKFN